MLGPRFFSSLTPSLFLLSTYRLSLTDYPRPFSFRKTNVIWKSYGYDLRFAAKVVVRILAFLSAALQADCDQGVSQSVVWTEEKEDGALENFRSEKRQRCKIILGLHATKLL
ncbi:uncharacterized protein [Pyrus communis]|uniref:uncharacterized protein isoform X2 n=1 Tax=Pyrus communis TaxID=23211 RepID=UPI0035C09D7E